ncbi:unnamed protein product [Owenia fusiformis]|uniref:Uncharacterized protein n=1 Tax=Owenia fusiformis TaxID=6347 RepID=A0A8J1V0H5_OWEFU|nr:unnamed protein product [Owenia fusiformis]
MKEVNFETLLLLLKAPSKEAVVRLCNEAFLTRNGIVKPDTIKEAANGLQVEQQEAKQLISSLQGLVKNALFHGSTEPAVIVKLFPNDFHKNLRDLLGKILIENIPNWKNIAVNNMVSLPRLTDFDWRVDIKTASDSMARMNVPTCILQLKVQEAKTNIAERPNENNVNVELSKETLETMLDGLGKIRDQLSSVAK